MSSIKQLASDVARGVYAHDPEFFERDLRSLMDRPVGLVRVKMGGEIQQQPIDDPDRPVCKWTWNPAEEWWETTCGKTWWDMANLTPDNNKFNFCFHCAGKLEEVIPAGG